MRGKSFCLGFILVFSLITAGCWDRRELDELAFVSGVGIDLIKEQKKVEITIQVIKPGGMKSVESPGSGGDKAFFTTKSIGKTPFEAVRNISFKISRRVNYTHNSVLVFGKNLAQEGIPSYLDFFIRDPELRPLLWVLMTEEKSETIFNIKPDLEKSSAMIINGLLKNAQSTSEVSAISLQEVIVCLMSKTQSLMIPVISTIGKGDQKNLIISGAGVFKKGKIISKLNPIEVRGILWITGKVKGGILVIPVSKEEKVSLEIINASSSFKPEFKKDKLTVKARINVTFNLGEQETRKEMSTSEGLAKLEKISKTVISKEITKSLKKLQRLSADVYGFGEEFAIHYPRRWKKMESRWDQLFPKVELMVEIRPAVRLLGKTTKALHNH